MTDYGGFLLCITEENRSDELRSVIKRDNYCEEGFSKSALEAKMEAKIIEIGLLSFRNSASHKDEIAYAALIRRGGSVLTNVYKVEFLKCVPLKSFPVEALENATETKAAPYVIRSFSKEGGRVHSEIWSRWINYIKEQQPEVGEHLDLLELIRQPPKFKISEGTSRSFALQQDALGLALELAGLNRGGTLSLWHPSTPEPESYFEGFMDHYVSEDQAIAYDSHQMPAENWSEFRRDVKGAVEFRNGDEAITVVEAHRGKVENTFGVDIIYQHHAYNSFVMVQYKSMEKKDGEKAPGYRPTDANYKSEILRMQTIHNQYQDISKRNGLSEELLSLRDYRLNSDVFYFKICEELLFERSPDLIDGVYFPLEFWNKLLQSEEGKGSLGGLRIMRSKVRRYFSNSLFIELVQKGWIGSRLDVSDALNILLQASIHSLDLNRVLLWVKSRKLPEKRKQDLNKQSIFSR